MSVPQLVTASPSATKDGGLVLGSRHSSVYVVDARTGTLLSILSPDAAAPTSATKSGTKSHGPLCYARCHHSLVHAS